MFRLLLVISIVLLSGCSGGKCIGPSTGTISSQEIVVPVMPKGADSTRPAMYWVNSGYKINDKDKIDITVEGTINFCPLDTAAKPVKVSMYPDDLFATRTGHEFTDTHINVVAGDRLTFYAHSYNLTIPTCDELLTSNDSIIYYGNGVIFSDSGCGKVVPTGNVCSAGAASVDKGVTTSSQYKLHMKDDADKCTPLPEGASFPRVGGTLVKTPRLQFPLGYIGHLKTGTPNVIKPSEKSVVVTGRVHDARTMGVALPAVKLDGETCKLFEAGYLKTTLSNLVSVKQLAAGGRSKDYQRKYEIIDPSGSTNTSTQDDKKKKIEQVLAEYTEYDINCHCGFICQPNDTPENKKDSGCVRSIVRVVNNKLVCPTEKLDSVGRVKEDEQRKKEDKIKGTLESISGSKDKDPKDFRSLIDSNPMEALGIKDFPVLPLPSDTSASVQQNVEPSIYEMAQGASAAIVDLDNASNERAEDICKSDSSKCKYFPEGIKDLNSNSQVTFSQGSLKLDYQYKVEKSGRLFLFYNMPLGKAADSAQNTGSNSSGEQLLGFYDIEVRRTCYASEGKNLYMYIGENPPDKAPGSHGNGDYIDIGGALNKGKYTINGNGTAKTGQIYFGIKVDKGYEKQLKKAGDIENNYTVRMFVPKWPATFSKFFSYLQGTVLQVLYGTALTPDTEIVEISKKVDEALSGPQKAGAKLKVGAVQQIYNNQVVSKPLWTAVRALLTLYLMFSVLGYIIGILQVTKYDLAVRIAKISMILTLVSPGSWDFFYKHCFSLFIQGIPEIISAFNGYLGGDSSFKFLDSTLGLFLESEFWLRMLALFLAGPVGWLLFVGIIWALWAFFKAMLRAIILYLFVIVALAFLVTLAPIFITFVLFQLTKGFFDSWIKMIVNFSLQPIILFASLAFLNQIILTSIHAVTDFTACETCVIGFDIVAEENKSVEKKDICVVPALLPIGFSNDQTIDERIREGLARGSDVGFMGLPFSVAMVMVLILSCKATEEFGRISEVLAQSISGSVAGVAASAVGASQALLGVVGLDAATQNLIRSARSMIPVGTEKLAFDTAESEQPRHEGVMHRPGFDPQGAGDSGNTQEEAGGQSDGAQSAIRGAASTLAAAHAVDVVGDMVRGAGGAATELQESCRHVPSSGVDEDEQHVVSGGSTGEPVAGGEEPSTGHDVTNLRSEGDTGHDNAVESTSSGPNEGMVDSVHVSPDEQGFTDNMADPGGGDDVVYSAHAPEEAGFEDLLGAAEEHAAPATGSEHGGDGKDNHEVSDSAAVETRGSADAADVEEEAGHREREEILTPAEDSKFADSYGEIDDATTEAEADDSGSDDEGQVGYMPQEERSDPNEDTYSAADEERVGGDTADTESISSEPEDMEVTGDPGRGEDGGNTGFSESETVAETPDNSDIGTDSIASNEEAPAASREIDAAREVESASVAKADAVDTRNNYVPSDKDLSHTEGAEGDVDSDKKQRRDAGDGFEEKLSKDPDNVRSGNAEEDK